MYSYLNERDRSAEDLVRTAFNFVNNKRQLAIEEIRVNLAQARSALQTETDRLESMKTIVENDRQLRESVAGARAQAKIEAKRAALEDTLKQWREELKSVPPSDLAARDRLKDKYREIVDAHLTELRDAINSDDSGLTEDEINLANDSVDKTEDTIDDYVDDLSKPPADDDNGSDDGNTSDNGNGGGTIVDDGNGDLPPPPPLVIDDDDVDDQEDTVDDLSDDVDNLEDDLDDLLNDDTGDSDGGGDNTDDGTLPPDDSDGDLPPLPPPQPRELNPDKPKLLQGSDL